MTRLTLLLTTFLVLPTADALAGAGGGSSGYSGGGGGGGGYSGGGYSGSGGGSGDGGPWWIWPLLIVGFLIFCAFGAWAEHRRRAKRRERVGKVILASREAEQDDAWFEHKSVERDAAELFRTIQKAWDDRDRDTLSSLVGDDLMVEWRRRLDDFDRKGWHNTVTVNSGPVVSYVGMTNREDDTQDRVVVHVEAEMRDVVVTKAGVVMKKEGESAEQVTCSEYWTLARRDDRWTLVSIEQDDEGDHHLEADIIATPWADEQGLRDESALELAQRDVPVGVTTGELADVGYAGDARKQALDLSLVDERFSPHVLEAAARRAVSAWAEAVDGDDAALNALAGDEAVHRLLHGADASASSRLVVRGLKLDALQIAELDADTEPPRLTIAAELRGRRYVEDRDTLQVLSGSRDREVTFTERWTLVLDGGTEVPWRLADAAPVG